MTTGPLKGVLASRSLPLAMVVVGVASFVAALVALGASATYGARTTADEPQYLLTALSLGEDLDLDISDEIETSAYLPFHEIPLNEQTIELNDAGQRLSPHDPLLPMLLAVPMRLGGWAAAKATLALAGGLTAALTLWVAVRRFGVGCGVGAVVVGAFFLSPPLVAYGTQIYPEMPAALLVVAGLGALTGSLRRAGLVVALGAVVALPWLAVKYAPLAAVLALGVLFVLWRQGRRSEVWVSGAVLAVAGVLYLLFHQEVYGGWTVYAAGDHFVDGEFQVLGSDPSYWGRSRRLLGLLVDRRFGLLAWAPAYLALIPAVAVVLHRRPRGAVPLLALLGTGWAMATWVALTMHGWWWPGRQLVVVLPLAVLAIAVLAWASRIWLAFVVAGAAVALFSWLWLVVEASTDRLTLIVDFFDTTNPWYRAWSVVLPDHVAFRSWDVLLTIGWAALLAALTAATIVKLRPASPRSSATSPRPSATCVNEVRYADLIDASEQR